MPTLGDELARAFLAVSDDVLGSKKSRKLVWAMLDWMVDRTPPNGIGPLISVRREAMDVLAATLRELERRA